MHTILVQYKHEQQTANSAGSINPLRQTPKKPGPVKLFPHLIFKLNKILIGFHRFRNKPLTATVNDGDPVAGGDYLPIGSLDQQPFFQKPPATLPLYRFPVQTCRKFVNG
ncbi:hypothetical protein HanXRQr2_Chr14g0657591 [Helianthus annuus]|uniref:Uncharacterized protein n=1 Tax=Helianthus annuus TaxID=4232 RepID=A0A9K3H9M2_HELAN|nr:hypothetical protein HanXRQr2_Chr14g0657591 [Helianthus annuus]KAJ0841448.1 hypothetical protein HanPSC8_Chr14g0630451 [Helianthus annuus]